MNKKGLILLVLIILNIFTIPVKASTTQTLIDSYTDATSLNAMADHHPSDSGFYSDGGQAVNITTETWATSVKFRLNKNNSPTGISHATIYASTGTYGVNATPTGLPLGTSTGVDVSTFNGGWFSYNFTSAIHLTPGIYFVVYENPETGTITAANYPALYVKNPGADPGNAALYANGVWIPQAAIDCGYYLYGYTTEPYEYQFENTYYENGTIYHPPQEITATGTGFTETFNVSGGITEYFTTEPDAFYWDIGGGYARYIYSFGSEALTMTMPESTFYSYGFTIKDYTGKLGLGDAYLEAYRTINGTETLIERMKIIQPNPVPLNLVFGRTYHLKILFADGTRYDWGYYLAGTDTTATILIRSSTFTDQAHIIYNVIYVEATRSTDGQTITINYNDTRTNTIWANVTITRRNDGLVLFAARNNDTYTLNWANANASLGYVVSVNGVHSDFGEWGYVKIFDEQEAFPSAPTLEGIYDFGLGSNLGGWVITIAATIGFSKALKSRALIIGSAVATLTNYIGFSSWTYNQLIFIWFFSIVVALATGGSE